MTKIIHKITQKAKSFLRSAMNYLGVLGFIFVLAGVTTSSIVVHIQNVDVDVNVSM